MSLFGRKEKKEIEQLRSMIPSEGNQIIDLQKRLEKISGETDLAEEKLLELQRCCEAKRKELEKLESDIVETRDEILYQDFALYTPRYNLMKADDYKERLQNIRFRQKEMIRSGTAVTADINWQVNGSIAKGKKMVSDMQKLLLRAFNSECDDVIEHVKYNNIDASEKRITKSRDAISKLGSMMSISIAPRYYDLKIQELHLAFEYQRKKELEREEQRETRARMREEARLAKEIEEERKKLEKEQKHYKNALQQIDVQFRNAADEDKEAILAKRNELLQQLSKIDEEFKAVDYREANQRAGYVYVISNIGAFGENVYKIGMTRRLDPQERVDELGDASVPFKFDVHAMIFSDNAPGLEAALHNAFADRKVNYINQRREFFRVSLDEIKKVVKENYDGSAEFTEIAPAEQYRESLKIQESMARS